MNVETILKFPSNSFLLCEMGTGLQNSWYRGYGTGLQRDDEYSFEVMSFNTENGWLPLWFYSS